jgi:hypothetical protein
MHRALTLAVMGMAFALGSHALPTRAAQSHSSAGDHPAKSALIQKAEAASTASAGAASGSETGRQHGTQPDEGNAVPYDTPAPRANSPDHTPAINQTPLPDNLWAFLTRKVDTLAAGLASLIFAICAVAMIGLSVFNPSADRFYFRRHWGGFGGSSTGWHISTPLAQLGAGMLLATIAGLLAFNLLVINQKSNPAAGDTADKTTAKASVPIKVESQEKHQ